MSPSASSSSSLSSHHNDNCHHHHNHHNHHPHVIDIDNPNLDSRPAVPAVEPSHTQQPRQSPTDIRLFNSTSFNDSTPENSYNRTYPSSNSDRNHSLSSPLLCKQDPSQSTLPPNAPTTPRNRESVVKFFSDTDSYRSFAASFFPEDSDGRSLKATVSVTGSFCAFIVFCIGVAISVITLIRVRAADFAEHDLNCAQLARQIKTELLGSLAIAQGYSAFVNATGYQNLKSDAFDIYGRSMSVTWSLYGTTWVQRVYESERAAYEAKFGTEIIDFTTEEKSAVHDVYYPITFTYPQRPTIMGFDYQTEEIRRQAMIEAWEAKTITYSTVFNVLNYTEGAGILLLFPHYNSGIADALAPGFLLSVLRGPEFIESAVTNNGAIDFQIRVLVGDIVLYNSYNRSEFGQKNSPFLQSSNYQCDFPITKDRDIVWTLQCRKTINIGNYGVGIILVGFFITTTSVFATRVLVKHFEKAMRTARLNAQAKGKALLEFSRLKASAHTVLKTIADPLIVFDAYGRVQQHNTAALALFKCPNAKPGLVGFTASDLFVHHRTLSATRSSSAFSSQSGLRSVPSSLDPHNAGGGSVKSSNDSMSGGEETDDPLDISDLLSKSGVRELYARQLNGAHPLLTEANVSKRERGGDAATVILLRDVTQQRAAAKELKKTKSEAETANMEKGVFLAFLCHELRNPLTVILGMTGLLADTNLSPIQKDYQTSLAFSAQVMLEIVNDVLDLERGLTAGPRAIEKIPFDLYELIRDVDRVQRVVVQGRPAGVEWVLDCSCNVPKVVLGDPTKLRQCLSNLICNSIKFTRKGWIRLTVEMPSSTASRVDLRFTVEDTGIGVASEDIPNLLKPYSQANVSIGRTFGGSGLGLSITNNLVHAMESKTGLVIESTVGEGTRTWFDLGFGIPPEVTVPVNPLLPMVSSESLGSLKGTRSIANILSSPSGDITPIHDPCREYLRVLRLTPPRMPRSPDAKDDQDSNRANSEQEFKFDSAFENMLHTTIEQKNMEERSNLKSSLLMNDDHSASRDAIVVVPKKVDEENVQLTVLLVEDNAMIQRLGVAMLQKEGFRTVTASNGAEAVEVLDKGNIDVCLMDLMMPVMDGFTAATEVIHRGIHVPIIALTANAIVADRDRCFEIGFVGYCTKPLGKKEMGSVVRHAYAMRTGNYADVPDVHKGTTQIFWRHLPN